MDGRSSPTSPDLEAAASFEDTEALVESPPLRQLAETAHNLAETAHERIDELEGTAPVKVDTEDLRENSGSILEFF